MLPKVATHILHQTTRAATAVQSQTNHIRNVLQLQSSSGTSNSPGTIGGWNGAGSSSSGWGGQGSAPGGARYHTGSRFYSYTGAGRAVTHANSTTSHDPTQGQSDDKDDLTPKHLPRLQTKGSRLRSASLSVNRPGRHDSADRLGVLKTVQMFARSRHAFAPLHITGHPEHSDGHSVPDGTIIPLARPIPVRRNSTSVPLIVPDGSRMLSSPPSPTGIPTLSILDPATPQSVSPPSVSSPLLPVKDGVDEQSFSAAFIALRDSRDSKDYLQALREVQSFRATAMHPTVAEFNMALEALHETRVEGHPLDDILETYNDMISRSIYPNARTYMILILALTDRDHEVHMTIDSLATRGKWNARYGQSKFARKESEDEQKFANLRQENNFSSALSLFEATTALTGFRKIPLIVYSNLLRSAAYHANVDAALTIFAHLEKRHDILPSIAVFWNLISVYANAGDISGAKEVFDEFRNAVRNRSIAWTDKMGHRSDGTEFAKEITPHGPQRVVWNKMIEAYVICGQPVNALSLLEQMMDAKSGGALDIAGPPPPTSSTYTHIISAFCRLGDIKTALGWFDRLLYKQENAGHPSEAAAIPPRPDQLAWSVMIHHLAHEEMVDDLNRIFAILLDNAESENLDIRAADRVVVFATNMRALDASRMADDRAIEILDFLSERVVPQNRFTNSDRVTIHFPVARQMILALAQKYIKFDHPDGAYRTLERYSRPVLDWCRQVEGEGAHEQDTHSGIVTLRKMICETSPEILDTLFRSQTATFDDVFQIARLSDRLGLSPHRPVAPYYLHAFARAVTNGQSLALSFHDWELLLYAAAVMELPATAHPKLPDYAFGGIPFLLEQLASFRIPLESLSIPILNKVSRVLRSQYEAEDLKALFGRLGPAYEKTLNSLGRDLGPEETPAHKSGFAIRCDIGHSRYVDQHYPSNPNVTPLNAYARFEAGVRSGNYPVPATIGRLINSLGRLGEFDKVRRLYDAGQLVLSSFDQDKVLQSQGWFQIEDSMIIANAHGGNVEAAHVHRNRILQQGGAPTADAYGALIQAVKDTTDDCSNALALFHEAQLRGVTPSVYLFNTIISKLAKARKADFAIELFQQMKASGFSPSSITFGAVIAACARVGDAQSAEQLFDEMTRQPNFKPRIPPYNTMIQMYTTTKPSRERALYFYEQLRLLGIGPTAHTYKLLIDNYGTVEPIDVAAMEDVFERLTQNPKVAVQGAHWASLINAYGCVQKDLNKAIAIFDSIETHPRTLRSPTPLPDAVTYEAMINVLVAHRRTDLIPEFILRLQSSKIHLTAYIANIMIKGFATVGDLAKAREVFEELHDPPEGIAAPNNHAPHEGSQSQLPNASAAVYREPSTWEAMVRAELGNGNREDALALIARLQARKFPAAVENRISSIMLDDSVSPWSSNSPLTFESRTTYS